jgi:hypothetical protein
MVCAVANAVPPAERPPTLIRTESMPRKPTLVATPPDEIERCVRTVDLVLRRRGNRKEAVAAIDRLLGAEPPPPPTLSSSVHDIGLGLRTASMLDDQGIETAAALRLAVRFNRLWAIPNFGPAAIRECVGAIRLIEGKVWDWQI